jgi:hypothetical protein
MLKAAEALALDGYEVSVLSTTSTAWAREADESVLEKRRGLFRSTVIDYTRTGRPGTYFATGARQKLARLLAARLSRPPYRVATRAFARVHDELVAAAVATGAEFFYGGTTGGIAATAEAARRRKVPFALDLEDFFSGEPPAGSLEEKLARCVEEEILDGAKFLTASSEAIASEYRSRYGVSAATIHNTFPLPVPPPSLETPSSGPLRLYWFSQTIGPGRGLEQAIRACGLAEIEAELHLRGAVSPELSEGLLALGREEAPRLAITFHPPGLPDEMTRLAQEHDVGLSLEQAVSRNRLLCLTNKALVYMVAGLALALTETPGHEPLLRDLGDAVFSVPTGDIESLSSGLRRFATDRELLARSRRAAWDAARRRWHWEHSEERGRLLGLFREI